MYLIVMFYIVFVHTSAHLGLNAFLWMCVYVCMYPCCPVSEHTFDCILVQLCSSNY